MTSNADGTLTNLSEIGRRTRKDIADWLTVEGVAWSGRLAEEAFLDRFVDLDALPSTDSRFPNARYDLRQHRVSNYDWDDDWLYSYEPLNLLQGDSETFAQFLCEMVHPIVRPDSNEARRLAGELNDLLKPDGLEMFENGSIGARPTFGIRSFASSGSPRSPRGLAPKADPRREDEHRLWEAGMLRLFLSHVSSQKVQIAGLKANLRRYGVDSFVAHEDIEPSLEWQAEIEEALRSMHAMSAILTEDFHDSKWTDQEVGIALGLGVLVVPVRAPDVPYGFMGKLQALRGDLSDTEGLASRLVDVLLRRPETASVMRAGLATALEGSLSYATSKMLVNKLESAPAADSAVADRLDAAIATNPQVGEAFGVPERLRTLAERFRS